MNAELWKWAAGLNLEWLARMALVQLISDFEYGGAIFEYEKRCIDSGLHVCLVTRSCEVSSGTLSRLIKDNIINLEILSDTQCQVSFNYKDEAE